MSTFNNNICEVFNFQYISNTGLTLLLHNFYYYYFFCSTWSINFRRVGVATQTSRWVESWVIDAKLEARWVLKYMPPIHTRVIGKSESFCQILSCGWVIRPSLLSIEPKDSIKDSLSNTHSLLSRSMMILICSIIWG